MTDDERTIRLRGIANDLLGLDERELGQVQQCVAAIKRVRDDQDLVIPIESARSVEFEIVAIPTEGSSPCDSERTATAPPVAGHEPALSAHARDSVLGNTPAQGRFEVSRAPFPRVVRIPPKGTPPPPIDARFDVSEIDDVYFSFEIHPEDAATAEMAKRARRDTDHAWRGKR